MKLILTNVPLRNNPGFPPVGLTRIYDSLIEAGYNDVGFYDVDSLRPNNQDIINYFVIQKPDIIGISAVVSTSYKYVKWFTNEIKKYLPNVKIIIGGNMAVSFEILLLKCAIDLCVIGDGEITIINICKHFETYCDFYPNEDLKNIKGIAFIDLDKNICFTGYPDLLQKNKIRQPNYDLLLNTSKIEYFIKENPQSSYFYNYDIRTMQKHRIGKKGAIIMASKGCTARCTFCHRWTKGYRIMEVDSIIEYIKYLQKKFNVGFFDIGDESFGADKKFVNEFIDKIKPLDIIWTVAMRVEFAEKDMVKKMKDAGCASIIFGIESGSNRILTIMEKKVKVEDNIKALKLLKECGLFTIIQLVIGMPGENNETIKETINFLNDVVGYVYDPMLLSVNYAQALPGSTLYDYALLKKYINNDIDSQEEYLLKISDVNAADIKHYINMTSENIIKLYIVIPY